MRQSIGRCHADYVFNLFTSFGYFSDQENHAVMRNISDALKPGGTLVVDYLNVNYAEARLVPSEEKEIDRAIYNITRWTDQDHFFKKITVLDERTGQVLEYTERVAKLTLEDCDDMLAHEHLQSESAYGDYGLNTYDEAKSRA
jgi:SAM-dependent methyltransferase